MKKAERISRVVCRKDPGRKPFDAPCSKPCNPWDDCRSYGWAVLDTLSDEAGHQMND